MFLVIIRSRLHSISLAKPGGAHIKFIGDCVDSIARIRQRRIHDCGLQAGFLRDALQDLFGLPLRHLKLLYSRNATPHEQNALSDETICSGDREFLAEYPTLW